VAFEQATGRSLADAERSFHAELTSWTRRLPLMTSPSVLWMIVTLLALFAIYVSYRRRAERRRKWAEEDARDVGWLAEETLADETLPRGVRTPPRDWVH
jgi:beta-lactamase regulating signal transducer with metallopeptidase domain